LNQRGLLGNTVRWLSDLAPDDAARVSQSPILLLPAHTVVDPGSLERLGRATSNSHAICLEETKGSTAPILQIPPGLTGKLWKRLVHGEPIGEELEAALRRENARLVTGGGYAVAVTDPESARRARAKLYQGLGTSADGWVDRILNRRCSRLFTHLLVYFPITPNQISVLSLALGFAGAYGFWNASLLSALVGALFYELAVILDHTDGEIARLKFLESPLGEWLDFSIDTLIHGALVLGMGVTASRSSGLWGMGLSILAATGIVMSAVVARTGTASGEPHGSVGRLLRRMANRDLFYLVVIASLIGLWRLPSLLPWLVGVLAIGSHGYWLTSVVHRAREGR
jgi:phosphatidylglycerophosphate synthase